MKYLHLQPHLQFSSHQEKCFFPSTQKLLSHNQLYSNHSYLATPLSKTQSQQVLLALFELYKSKQLPLELKWRGYKMIITQKKKRRRNLHSKHIENYQFKASFLSFFIGKCFSSINICTLWLCNFWDKHHLAFIYSGLLLKSKTLQKYLNRAEINWKHTNSTP